MNDACIASHTSVTSTDALARRSAAFRRRSSTANSAKIHSGAAANSFAKMPSTPASVARAICPRQSQIAIMGPSMYISGSDVYTSNSEYSEPAPSADSHIALSAAVDDSPSSRLKRQTATAPAAFASTAYVFHLTIDDPGNRSRTTEISRRKQSATEQPGITTSRPL